VATSPLIKHFSALAKELEVVLPLSLFEKHNNAYYNSLVMIDADGTVMETYRKTHIPNGPAYQEKQFFIPGDTGFKVWNTRYAKIGVGICWDQWFPETARCLALNGAEIIFYPTAIGSEPAYPDIDSQPHWTRVQQGHAAANLVPVIASNRIGTEASKYIEGLEMTFYGSSFIADQTGELVAQANKTDEAVLVHTFDLDAIAAQRASWACSATVARTCTAPSRPLTAAKEQIMSTLTTPRQDGFAMPAEWAPHQAVWMCWPYRTDNWRANGAPAQQAFAAVAEAISRKTPVIMAVPHAEMEKARKTMPASVTLVEMESDDAWMRDTGPTVVVTRRERFVPAGRLTPGAGCWAVCMKAGIKTSSVAGQVAQYHRMPCYHTT
jgi:N-carbamoylputrescine amidase